MEAATPPGSGRSPVSSSRSARGEPTYFSPRDDRFASSRQEAPRSSRTASSDEQWGTPRAQQQQPHGGTPRMIHQSSFSSNDDYLSATSRSATSRSAEYSYADARPYNPPSSQSQYHHHHQQRSLNNITMLQQPSHLLSNRSASSSDNFATTRSWESVPQSPHQYPPRPIPHGPPSEEKLYSYYIGGGGPSDSKQSPYTSSFAPRPTSASVAAGPQYGLGDRGSVGRADAKWSPAGVDDYKGYYRTDLNAIGEDGGVFSSPGPATADGPGPGLSEADVLDIFSFARHGRAEEIERLLNRGVPVDVRDEFGNTILITACQNGNKRVAKAVLRRGANINARNLKGNTPLHYCFHFGYGDSLGQYLISKGADETARNNIGAKPFDGI